MKCFTIRLKLLVLLLSVLVFSSSCGILKRRTVTVTQTVTRIDTIIKIAYDTTTIIKEVKLTDTLVVENKVAIVRTFYNPVKNKIVVELKGKVFDVPVKAEIVKKEKIKEIKPAYFNFVILCIFALFMLIILLYLFIKFFKDEQKR